MNSSHKLFACILTLFTITAIPVNADHYVNDTSDDYKPTAEQIIIDGLIYRPLSLAGTIVGTGIFIVTLPFSIFSGNLEDVADRLVVEPAQATFNRCLGCKPDDRKLERR